MIVLKFLFCAVKLVFIVVFWFFVVIMAWFRKG